MYGHQHNVPVLVLALVVASTFLAGAVAAPAAASTMDRSLADQDEFEPNDDFENATNITSGTYTELRIEENDLDIYAVDLDAGEALSASIAFSHREGDLELALVYPSGEGLITQSATAADVENVSYVAPEAGSYYLVVYGYEGATADYDLSVATSDAVADGDGPPANQTAADGTDVTDSDEPNDDVENATNVSSGTYENRSVQVGDVDIYAIDLSDGDALSAAVRFAHSEGDLDAFLIGPDLSSVASSESTTDDETISYVAPKTGTYYLVVFGYENATAGYDLSVAVTSGSDAATDVNATDGTNATNGTNVSDGGNATELAPDEFEPNDSFDTASAITDGTYANLTVTNGDLDFYAVDLAAGDLLDVALRFSHADGDLDAAIVDAANGSVVARGITSTDDENASHLALENGTYYVVVYGYDNATAPYEMTASVTTPNATGPTTVDTDVELDRFEPNDDLENATAVDSGTYDNLSVGPNDLDVFAVELNASETLSASLDFDPITSDLDVLLVGPERAETLTVSQSSNAVENLSHVALQEGTYYLVVYGFENATGPYNLTVTVAAGGTTTGPPGNASEGTADDGNASDDGTPATAPPDPDEDVLGWEDGYWANESIDVDPADGLTGEELDAYLARAMARVEEIRQREFARSVGVSVQSRAELVNASAPDPFAQLVQSGYYNQLYEATFIVDEETDAYEEVVGEASATTGGYYGVGTDQIVIVAENESAPVIGERTLIHELTHALQDQHFDLFAGYRNATTADSTNGLLGLTEGDANYVMYEFEDRCSEDWECIESPQAGQDDGVIDFNVGIYVGSYMPYSDGPALVSELLNRSGGDWSAVDAAYRDPPVSAEQVIHPDRYPDEEPDRIEDPAGRQGDWQLFGVERLGEAWLYAMFFYQNYEYDISVIDTRTFGAPEAGPYDTYNYTSEPTAGWGNDQLRMYTDGSDYGYVWTVAWDSEADATEFREAYEEMLAGHGAEQRASQTWVIPESEAYGDAFSVGQDGRTVTIVNAPDSDSLAELAPTVVDRSDGTNTSRNESTSSG